MQAIMGVLAVLVLGAGCGWQVEPGDGIECDTCGAHVVLWLGDEAGGDESMPGADATGDEGRGDAMGGASAYVGVVTEVDPPGSGAILRTPDRAMVARDSWMQLEAVALPGFCFDHWQGDVEAEGPIVRFRVQSYTVVWASFAPCVTN